MGWVVLDELDDTCIHHSILAVDLASMNFLREKRSAD